MIDGVLETAASRLKGAPVATIKVEAEIDVIKQWHLLQASETTKLSRLPSSGGRVPNLVDGAAFLDCPQSVLYGGIGHE
jgi:hypothetical protein